MKQIGTVWKKELLDNFRDRRTLLTAILMPVVLMPLLLIGSFKLQEVQIKSAEEDIAQVAINSIEAAPTLVTFFEANDKIEIKETTDYVADIDASNLHVYVQVADDFEQALIDQQPTTVTVYSKSSKLDSETAKGKINAALAAFNQVQGVARLTDSGVDLTVLQSITLVNEDIATAEERGGFFIGLLLPMFIVIFAIVGGMYIAIDVSAGEKERKTLEALLLAPLSRFKLVMGKYIAVTTMATITIILSLASMSAAFMLSPPNFGDNVEVVFELTATAVGVMLVFGILMAIMFSGLLLSVAIFAKSYKEAQNYISPFYLLAILPVSIANTLPGFEPSTVFYLIPGMNAVLVIKEALLGVYDVTHIGVSAVSLLFFAAVGVIVSGKIYSKEGILFRD